MHETDLIFPGIYNVAHGQLFIKYLVDNHTHHFSTSPILLHTTLYVISHVRRLFSNSLECFLPLNSVATSFSGHRYVCSLKLIIIGHALKPLTTMGLNYSHYLKGIEINSQ